MTVLDTAKQTLCLRTGVQLHYVAQGDPSAPPLILLHGYTDSSFSFSRVLPELAAHFRLYAIDQRGHGDSERPQDGYTMPQLAEDIIALMDALGLARASVVGHSMGSIVATYVALAAPQRVERLALMGAASNWRTPDLVAFLQVVDALDDPVPAEFARAFQESANHRPLPEGFLEQVVAESLKLPAHVWRAALRAHVDADYAARLGELCMPTLLLWGERDAYCSRDEQGRLLAGLGNATLKIYAETGHTPHWERPDLVVGDLEQFLLG
jgi:non-heme chloroperoxidase